MSKLVGYLLLAALVSPTVIYSAPNQLVTTQTTYTISSTSTSYSTYAQGTTLVTFTSTSTVNERSVQVVPTFSGRGCYHTAFQFTANAGDEVFVKYSATGPLDFHLMSVGQYQRVLTAFCGYALPGFPSIDYASSRGSYSLDWIVPSYYSHGDYYLVFFNIQTSTITLSLTAYVRSIQTTSSTVYSTAAAMVTLLITQTSSSIFALSETQSSPTVKPTQDVWWIATAAVLIVLVIGLFAMRRKRPPEKTQVY